MNNTSVKSTLFSNSFIVNKSTAFPSIAVNPELNFSFDRSLSEFGSDSYKRSLRRAFARAKLLAFFNPDLTEFITLTYKGADHTPEQVLADVKYLVKKQKRYYNRSNFKSQFKYMFVMEYQERGSIHVHMISNKCFTYQKNKNNHNELVYWDKGFSSVLSINDFDNNFRPYLYLFKYMHKSERIGNSFIHTSRSFDKIYNFDYADYINKLSKDNLLFKEDIEYIIKSKKHNITKEYYRS